MRSQRVKFIGLGGYCSGSDFLYTYLHAHPQTCIPTTATHFFTDPRRHERGGEWYESQFAACRSGRCWGECATDYLGDATAAQRIARMYPEAKLLAVVCNPIERLYTEYQRAKKVGSIAVHTTMVDYIEQHPDSLTRGLFGQQLDAYFGLYSPLQLLILVHEDRYADPVKYVQQAYEFLELNPSYVPKALRQFVDIDPDDPPPRPWWQRLLLVPLLPLRWLGIMRLGRYLKKKIWPILHRLLVRKGWWRATPAQSTPTAPPRAPVDDELRAILNEYYAADVRTLSRFLHRDLNVEWEIEMPSSK